MGTMVSTLQRKAIRKLRRFNVENRAQKVLANERRKAAPLPAQTIKEIEIIKKEYPDAAEAQLKKDPSLDTRLKQVFVTSQDPEVEIKQQSSRPLPQRVTLAAQADTFYSPSVISEGHCSLVEVVQFLTEHRSDPVTNTANTIATKYNLDELTVGKVLENYQIFIVEKLPQTEQSTLYGLYNMEMDNRFKNFNPPERRKTDEDRIKVQKFREKLSEVSKNLAAGDAPTEK